MNYAELNDVYLPPLGQDDYIGGRRRESKPSSQYHLPPVYSVGTRLSRRLRRGGLNELYPVGEVNGEIDEGKWERKTREAVEGGQDEVEEEEEEEVEVEFGEEEEEEGVVEEEGKGEEICLFLRRPAPISTLDHSSTSIAEDILIAGPRWSIASAPARTLSKDETMPNSTKNISSSCHQPKFKNVWTGQSISNIQLETTSPSEPQQSSISYTNFLPSKSCNVTPLPGMSASTESMEEGSGGVWTERGVTQLGCARNGAISTSSCTSAVADGRLDAFPSGRTVPPTVSSTPHLPQEASRTPLKPVGSHEPTELSAFKETLSENRNMAAVGGSDLACGSEREMSACGTVAAADQAPCSP